MKKNEQNGYVELKKSEIGKLLSTFCCKQRDARSLLVSERLTYFASIHFPLLRCHCGNCELAYLQNISECYCCCELDGWVEALVSDIVLQDLPEGMKLMCITEHPGFEAVCLEKWSLRLAADKYRTKSKTKYRQTGSEER